MHLSLVAFSRRNLTVNPHLLLSFSWSSFQEFFRGLILREIYMGWEPCWGPDTSLVLIEAKIEDACYRREWFGSFARIYRQTSRHDPSDVEIARHFEYQGQSNIVSWISPTIHYRACELARKGLRLVEPTNANRYHSVVVEVIGTLFILNSFKIITSVDIIVGIPSDLLTRSVGPNEGYVALMRVVLFLCINSSSPGWGYIFLSLILRWSWWTVWGLSLAASSWSLSFHEGVLILYKFWRPSLELVFKFIFLKKKHFQNCLKIVSDELKLSK